MNRQFLPAALGFLLLPGLLGAQVIRPISWADLGQRASGHKVTVSLRAGDLLQGTVARWDSGSFTVRDAKALRDREALRQDVSLVRVEGKRRRIGRFIGLGAGIAMGVALGVQGGANKAGKDGAMIAMNAVVWGGIGTLVGWGADALRTPKPVLYRIEPGR